MTHKELVERAARWLKRDISPRCSVVITKKSIMTSEQPDCIGWTAMGSSVVVEIKVGRADFKRDAAKPFRKIPGSGMGNRRFYVVPTGLVSVSELPDGWGLIESHWKIFRVVKPSSIFATRNIHEELRLLLSRIRGGREVREADEEFDHEVDVLPARLLS